MIPDPQDEPRSGTSLDAFDFDLPPERIAQHPVDPRDSSRLMVLDRRTGAVRHSRFDRLTEWLEPGDLLVANDSRVVPARLIGRRDGGGAVEALLVRREALDADGEVWCCLARPARRLKAGDRVTFGAGIEGRWLPGDLGSDLRRIRLRANRPLAEALRETAELALPPYIDRPVIDHDAERYQTVYAREAGSIAAPTAGLHFTPGLLSRLAERGIEMRWVTLHVGPGTFLPVRSATVEEHRMLAEEAEIVPETAAAIFAARRTGRRVVAVGTTTVRAVEGLLGGGVVPSGRRSVSLFITPGFRFSVVDALITNFHLPRSTLLLLVAAFAGRESLLGAYREAIERSYRFYSYGDAMLIQ